MITKEEMAATTPAPDAMRVVAVQLTERELAYLRETQGINRDATAVAAFVRKGISAEKKGA